MRKRLHAYLYNLLRDEFTQQARDIRLLQRHLEWLMRTCTRAQRRQWARRLRREIAREDALLSRKLTEGIDKNRVKGVRT
jgi:hypothetical protein